MKIGNQAMSPALGVTVEVDGPLGDRLRQGVRAFDPRAVLDGPGKPDILILAAGGDPEGALARAERAAKARPETEVFLVLPDMDAALLLRALRLGVREALSETGFQDDLPRALERHLRRRARRDAPNQERDGRLIAVIGSKGGVGVTTLAVGLAREFQRADAARGGRGAVLVDLNLPYGEAPLFLGLDVRPGLSEVLRRETGPQAADLAGFLARHESGCAVLALPMQMEEGPADIPPERLSAVPGVLRGLFDYVVADLGIYLDDLALSVMSMADTILVVGVQSLASVRNLRRFLEYAGQEHGLADKIRLVLNRYIADAELAPADMEKTLGVPIFRQIPNDYPATLEAINAGRPVTDHAPRSPVSKAIAALATDLAGGGRSRRLFGLPGLGLFGGKGKG